MKSDDRRLTNVSAGDTWSGIGPLGGRSLTTLLTGLLGAGIRGWRGEGKVDRSFDIDGPSAISLGLREGCRVEFRSGESSDLLGSGGFCLGKNCNFDLGIRTISNILTSGSKSFSSA